MTEQEISIITTKIVSDTKTWVALIGLLGAIVGSLLTILGNIVLEWFKNKSQKKIDKKRQEILKEMLEHKTYSWRNLETLSAVVGCDKETTKNHLISIGARGSENNDGKWSLTSRNPLKNIK